MNRAQSGLTMDQPTKSRSTTDRAASLARAVVYVAGLCAIASGGTAHAQAKAKNLDTEILVVLAKEKPGKIDPDLADLPALRRPPFNAFRSMKILSRPKHRIRMGANHDVVLPNGRRLRLVVQRVMPDGRYRVRVSINRPDKSDYLPLLQVIASPGDPFFVAGQSHDGGTLVIGVRLQPQPKSKK